MGREGENERKRGNGEKANMRMGREKDGEKQQRKGGERERWLV